jgi:hypothetical protein
MRAIELIRRAIAENALPQQAFACAFVLPLGVRFSKVGQL